MFKQYQRDTDPEFIKQLIKDIGLNARRMSGLSRSQRRHKSKQAVVDWVNSWDAEWDLACCWHAGENMRDVQAGWGADWLQRHLSAYFNKLHQHVFSRVPHNQRPQLPRFITLEYSHRVGWHAHGIMATPSHMTREQFSAVLRKQWLKHAGWGCAEEFKERMFWAEPIKGAYTHYALKSAINLHDDAQQYFRGFIDLHNTHRP